MFIFINYEFREYFAVGRENVFYYYGFFWFIFFVYMIYFYIIFFVFILVYRLGVV